MCRLVSSINEHEYRFLCTYAVLMLMILDSWWRLRKGGYLSLRLAATDHASRDLWSSNTADFYVCLYSVELVALHNIVNFIQEQIRRAHSGLPLLTWSVAARRRDTSLANGQNHHNRKAVDFPAVGEGKSGTTVSPPSVKLYPVFVYQQKLSATEFLHCTNHSRKH
jgi:hypothetical protein